MIILSFLDLEKLFLPKCQKMICFKICILIDLKLRGRKENGGDVTDYDESSATSNDSPLFAIILVALCLCLHHHLQLRTLHPAWALSTMALHTIARALRSSIHRDFIHPLVNPLLRDYSRGWISSSIALTT